MAARLESQLVFTWNSPSPAQVAAISDCFVAHVGYPGQNTGADLGLHNRGNPRATAPTGQLQTTWEHYHPAPAQLILQGGWRLVVSGHSQALQLTGLGKFLPLICQQPPRFNHKKRVYSAHTKDAPHYLAWVIGEAVPLDPTGYLLH